jgi:hypothetical protein
MSKVYFSKSSLSNNLTAAPPKESIMATKFGQR